MATVQCSGCGKTTTDDQLRDSLCGLCVFDRDKAKYSAENAVLEAESRKRRSRAQLATALSILLTIAAIVGYIMLKKWRIDEARERRYQYKEY